MSSKKWVKIGNKLKRQMALLDRKFVSITAAANYLNMSKTTLRDAFNRGDLDRGYFIAGIDTNVDPEPPAEDIGKFSWREMGNDAIMSYKAAEPLNAEQVAEISGKDLSEWAIVDQRVNLWQSGRKNKQVDLEWTDGKLSGTVKDDGNFTKTYLYQIDVKFTRKKRVPVKAIIQPIKTPEITSFVPLFNIENKVERILFITDPHFGFSRSDTGKLNPFHNRRFLYGMLAIADKIKPDAIVWGGDILDLPDFSSFDSDPSIMFNTQISAMEATWFLGQFRYHTKAQYVLEGNHDERFLREMGKSLKSALQLKPAHDIGSGPLMSIQKLLGLEEIATDWFGGYPDNYLRIGPSQFEHGNIVRTGSGKTVSSMIGDLTVSKFFGHIHRFEIASRWLPDEEKLVFCGTPGWAGNRHNIPGGKRTSNWAVGAFLINQNEHSVTSVNHISAYNNRPILNGELIDAYYFDEFIHWLPNDYRGQFLI